MKEPFVKSIHIYPIKGLGGIDLKEALALREGLQYDRRLMLVDESGRFISQREVSKMALFNCRLKDSVLVVSYESDELNIPMTRASKELKEISIWDSNFKASLHSDEVNKWFSDRLDKLTFLVALDPKIKRYKHFGVSPFSTEVSFADGYPYLILSEASMDLLNSKLESPILIDRFRANIVLSNCAAHEEDKFTNFKIGSAQFMNIKPCARCIVPTINQQTATRSNEPLKTLSTYRKVGNKTNFGVNSICREEGNIRIGDSLTLLKNS